jgi:hypothetical protein
LFPAVFTQKGKWLRDRFFGTDAVKSVHGFERQCADLAQTPSRMMARTVSDRMAAVAPRVRARAAEPLSGRLVPWQAKRACEKLEADLSGKLTLQEIAAGLGILATLNDTAWGAASDVVPKFISPSDPAAQWTGAHKGPAFFAYSDNYLIDVKFGVIVDVEASRSIRQAEVGAAKTMIERTEERRKADIRRNGDVG